MTWLWRLRKRRGIIDFPFSNEQKKLLFFWNLFNSNGWSNALKCAMNKFVWWTLEFTYVWQNPSFVWFSVLITMQLSTQNFRDFFTSFQWRMAMREQRETKADRIVWFFPIYALLKLFTEKWIAIQMKEFEILSGSLFHMRKKTLSNCANESRIHRLFVHFHSVTLVTQFKSCHFLGHTKAIFFWFSDEKNCMHFTVQCQPKFLLTFAAQHTWKSSETNTIKFYTR